MLSSKKICLGVKRENTIEVDEIVSRSLLELKKEEMKKKIFRTSQRVDLFEKKLVKCKLGSFLQKIFWKMTF